MIHEKVDLVIDTAMEASIIETNGAPDEVGKKVFRLLKIMGNMQLLLLD